MQISYRYHVICLHMIYIYIYTHIYIYIYIFWLTPNTYLWKKYFLGHLFWQIFRLSIWHELQVRPCHRELKRPMQPPAKSHKEQYPTTVANKNKALFPEKICVLHMQTETWKPHSCCGELQPFQSRIHKMLRKGEKRMSVNPPWWKKCERGQR